MTVGALLYKQVSVGQIHVLHVFSSWVFNVVLGALWRVPLTGTVNAYTINLKQDKAKNEMELKTCDGHHCLYCHITTDVGGYHLIRNDVSLTGLAHVTLIKFITVKLNQTQRCSSQAWILSVVHFG